MCNKHEKTLSRLGHGPATDNYAQKEKTKIYN